MLWGTTWLPTDVTGSPDHLLQALPHCARWKGHARHRSPMALHSTQLTEKFGGGGPQARLILYNHLSISEYRPLTYP